LSTVGASSRGVRLIHGEPDGAPQDQHHVLGRIDLQFYMRISSSSSSAAVRLLA
jgi:hypothetical protein